MIARSAHPPTGSHPFSSRGPSADGRVKPDVAAMGWGAIGLSYDGDTIAQINGTSFSSPIVAGLVACLWQLHPERTGHDIMHAVRRSASQANAPDDGLGYGIPNFLDAHLYLNATTGIAETSNVSITTFPMPFNESLTVVLPFAPVGPVQVDLFDATGRSVWTASVTGSVDRLVLNDPAIDALREGAYVMRIAADDQILSRVVIKAQ